MLCCTLIDARWNRWPARHCRLDAITLRTQCEVRPDLKVHLKVTSRLHTGDCGKSDFLLRQVAL